VAYILSIHFTPGPDPHPVSDHPFVFIRLGSLPLRYLCVNLSNRAPYNLPFSSRPSSDVPFVFHTGYTSYLVCRYISASMFCVLSLPIFYDSLPLPACFLEWRSFFFERYFTRTKNVFEQLIHGFSPQFYFLLRSSASRWRQYWITSWNEDFVFSPNDSSLVVPIRGCIDSID
jgi:hypothetical protein